MAIPQTNTVFALTAVNTAATINTITITDATVYSIDTVAIQSFANSTVNPGTATKVNSTAHGLINSEKIVIAGSSQGTQNGTFIISDVTTNSFDIPVAWTSDGGVSTWYLHNDSYYTKLFVLIQTSITSTALLDTLIVANNASDNLITSWIFNASPDGWYQSFMIPARIYLTGLSYLLGEVRYYSTRNEFVECTTAGTADNIDPLLSTGAIFKVLSQYSTAILHSAVNNSLMDEDTKKCLHDKRVTFINVVVNSSEGCKIDCKNLIHSNNLYQTALTDFSRSNFLDAQKNIELLIQLCVKCD